MYRLSKEKYSNLFQDAITSKYKKADKHTATDINKKELHTQEKQTSSAESKLTAQVIVSSR